MSIVKIDKWGRMVIPKKLDINKTKVLVINAGSYFITMPLSKTPEGDAANWLKTSKVRKELKVEAERLAQEDALNRAKRRNQL